MTASLTERVRLALQRLFRERRFSQTNIAKRLGIVPSAVSRTLTDPNRPITLDFLEALAAEVPGVHVSELVAPSDAVLKQLNAEEAMILRALRRWPASVTRALAVFLAFFADEAPVDVQTRNLHEYWRGLGVKDREWLFGVAVLLREGTLAPDLQAGLVERLEAERYTAAAQREGKRATTTPKRKT